MPIDTPYERCDAIIVRFNDSDATTDRADWKRRVTKALDRIESLPLGRELFDDIRQSERKVYLQPALAQGNQCAAANHNCYVRLRQAYEFSGDFRTELSQTVERLKARGTRIEDLAGRLAQGLSPVTVETARNISTDASTGQIATRKTATKLTLKGKVTHYVKDAQGQQAWKSLSWTTEDYVDLLEGLCDGSRKKMELQMRRPNGRNLADDLLRLLYLPNPGVATEICRRGDGANATVSFNPSVKQSCHKDKLVYRPPGIGLVHELIHAWRNVNGLRYFKDKEKVQDAATPDDEVMTTGFPPYHNEKFSENVFRTLWKPEWSHNEQLGLRVDY